MNTKLLKIAKLLTSAGLKAYYGTQQLKVARIKFKPIAIKVYVDLLCCIKCDYPLEQIAFNVTATILEDVGSIQPIPFCQAKNATRKKMFH